MSRPDSGPMGVAVFAAAMSLVNLAIIGIVANQLPEKCKCHPAPTPAPCCKTDECRQELAKVDARFGGVWDELFEVQEQLAKVKSCACGPVKECCCEPPKPCACSDKPARECKPEPPQPKVLLPTYRKRCR